MKKTIIMTLCLLMAGLLFAEGTPGLEFRSIDNNTAYDVRIGTATATHIDIPATYNERPVTTIAINGFQNYTSMTSITIPNSITSIGSGAFGGCTGLTTIDIPSSVTSIGNNAFQICRYTI